jgi:hypothetical protein
MYEPITVEVDRGYGEGNCRSYTIDFIGRLLRIVEAGHTTMRLYEWADLGRLFYLVHVEEDRPGRSPRRTLYPFINTHSAGTTPSKGYTAGEVSLAYPEFAAGRLPGATWRSRQRSRGHTRRR